MFLFLMCPVTSASSSYSSSFDFDFRFVSLRLALAQRDLRLAALYFHVCIIGVLMGSHASRLTLACDSLALALRCPFSWRHVTSPTIMMTKFVFHAFPIVSPAVELSS